MSKVLMMTDCHLKSRGAKMVYPSHGKPYIVAKNQLTREILLPIVSPSKAMPYPFPLVGGSRSDVNHRPIRLS